MRITTKDLEYAVKRLSEKTKLPLVLNFDSGYQLAQKSGDGLSFFQATLTDSKKDLYYQIQFCLEIQTAIEKQEVR